MVPRLWCPAVQCPECSYPNDHDFSFCQRCGYRRLFQSQQSVNSKIQLDLPSINNRLQSIQALRASKPYEKQKSALQKELENFLFSLPLSKSLSSAAPQDLVRFLIYKDRKGKTKVHKSTCPLFGSHSKERCQCPVRLAAGTVDSLIGKLRSIFNNIIQEEQVHGVTSLEQAIPPPITPLKIIFVSCIKSKPRPTFLQSSPCQFFWTSCGNCVSTSTI